MADDPDRTTLDESAATTTESANDDPDGKTLTALQGQIASQEAIIQQLKGTNGELLAKFSSIEQRLAGEQRREPEEPEVDPYEFDEEKLDVFRSDPAELVRLVKDAETRMRGTQDELLTQIVQLLDTRDGAFTRSFTDVDKRLRQNDPELLPWRDAIAKLREKPASKDFQDEQLIALAQELGMKPAYQFMGGPSARGPAPGGGGGSGKPTSAQRDATYQKFLLMSRGNAEKAEKLTKRYYKED